ncbi:MAG: LON peptidase substrate-binding domain-containing protein [Rhizobacter sp.]|nr:LON peptidase substrate-binding domain-containing protein [Bacteriovorax sp.]
MRHSFPTLYLFNNVFFPQTVIPLTVSDGVSKDVLLTCFEKSEHLAFYHPSLRSKKVGTLGKILMLEHNADGSMSVLVQGVLRVQLLTQEQHLPYPIFQVDDYFDTQDKAAVVLDDCIERLHSILDNWLHRHISSVKERDRFMKEMNTPARLINNLCMLVIKDVELKEIFLENTSIPDRVRMMDALLKGQSPEIEDMIMSEALKNFERLEPQIDIKDAI